MPITTPKIFLILKENIRGRLSESIEIFELFFWICIMYFQLVLPVTTIQYQRSEGDPCWWLSSEENNLQHQHQLQQIKVRPVQFIVFEWLLLWLEWRTYYIRLFSLSVFILSELSDWSKQADGPMRRQYSLVLCSDWFTAVRDEWLIGSPCLKIECFQSQLCYATGEFYLPTFLPDALYMLCMQRDIWWYLLLFELSEDDPG